MRSNGRPLPMRVAVALLVVAVAVQLAHGVPRPNAWASTHLLFDYALGPVRRGLVGELLRRTLGERLTQGALDAFAGAVLLGWLGLLAARWRRAAGHVGAPTAVALVAAFVGSVAFRTLLVDVGYLDHVGLLLALGCAWLPHRAVGDAARLAACAAGVLVHEAFVVAFLPLVLLDVVLAEGGAWRRLGRALAVGLPVVALLAVAADGLRLPEDRSAAYLAHVRARSVDVYVEAPAVDVLTRASAEGPNGMARLWADPARWRTLGSNGALTLPLALGFAGLAARATWRARRDLLAVAAIGVAPLAPLLLHAVAWDLCRFDALAVVGGFGALTLVVGRATPSAPLGAPWGVLGACTVATGAGAIAVLSGAVPIAP